MMLAARMATGLELRLPSPNAGLLLERFTLDLDLPTVRHFIQMPSPACAAWIKPLPRHGQGWDWGFMQALATAALELYRLHREGWSDMRLERRAQCNPFAQLMALLVAAMKLVYGLDGQPRSPPAHLPPVPNWQAWAQRTVAKLQSPAAFPLRLDQVRDLCCNASIVFYQTMTG